METPRQSRPLTQLLTLVAFAVVLAAMSAAMVEAQNTPTATFTNTALPSFPLHDCFSHSWPACTSAAVIVQVLRQPNAVRQVGCAVRKHSRS